MNVLNGVFYFVTCFVLLLVEASPKMKESQGGVEKIPPRLVGLWGQKYETVFNGTKYVFSFSNKTLDKTNASVIEEVGGTNHTLGRNNETQAIDAGTWVLLMYGSGDNYSASECSGRRRSNILVFCNPDAHVPELKFVEHIQLGKDVGCICVFQLMTTAMCPSVADEGLSRGSVFCIIFLTTVGVYLIIGICYRRMVVGAKGFEQIPHHKFWTRLGNLQADGCNLVCRRKEEETWQRLTSNPKDTQDDQDDALLRP